MQNSISDTQYEDGRQSSASGHGSTDLTAQGISDRAQSFPFTANQRYPDPAFEVLDPSFARYRLFSSTLEQLGTGMRWAEGPVYIADGRYLLLSDIPNNRIMKYDESNDSFSTWRIPSGFSNGLARDRQGRLLVCEHLGRGVTRTELDGSQTIIMDRFGGKRLNSPNDIVVHSDGSLWFTDPPFGIAGDWEGDRASSELRDGVYRVDVNGHSNLVNDDLKGPNGLAFTPDGRQLYIVESRAEPSRRILRYDVDASGSLSNRTLCVDADGPGALDGIAIDIDGNLWCGWGSNGALDADPATLDGVRVFDPSGKAVAHIHLPERCANLCFGGPKGNRLYMAASHSLYALYVATRGA